MHLFYSAYAVLFRSARQQIVKCSFSGLGEADQPDLHKLFTLVMLWFFTYAVNPGVKPIMPRAIITTTARF
jgi:hypothetical protein